jgi:hypothetical protein
MVATTFEDLSVKLAVPSKSPLKIKANNANAITKIKTKEFFLILFKTAILYFYIDYK